MNPLKIIHMISGPRNLSTALMYSFARRSDTKVMDEPFYAHYLLSTGIEHPGRDEVITSMPNDASQIQRGFFEHNGSDILFLKDMAHHLIQMDLTFLGKVENLFLIRDPKQLIASFAKVIPNPTVQDVGLRDEWQLFEKIVSLNGSTPVVLDSAELLKDPEGVLRKVCDALGIPFETNMLSWPKGGIPEDGVWAKYWYANVHESTGFEAQPTSTRPLPSHCVALYEEVLPYYEQLSKYTIKA